MSRQYWTDDKLLFRLMTNKSDKTRWDNIRVLRSRPSEELFIKSVELTKSKEKKNRIIGIDILAQLGIPPRPFLQETLKLYFDLLTIETDPEVVMSLLYAIGHNNNNLGNEQLDKICSFSNSDDSLIREGLVSALLGIDNLKAIEVLIQLSTDKLSYIRNWSTFGFGTLIERNNLNIREALWNRVNDKHHETKLEAIVGLAKRKDSRVKEVIKRELLDGDFGALLFDAIIETEDTDFIAILRQNLASIKDDTNLNPEWEKGLESCIAQLTELTNKRKTTA